MAKRKKLTKGVLCRDGEDHLWLSDWCVLFAATTAGGVSKNIGGSWMPISTETQFWVWSAADFRRRFPKVRIPTRGTCRETSLLI